ncbi:hypothetical protein PVAP13_5KG261000 [Panicum virgatum]|uniref:Protein kinase domain-containing protein n=1 Tax=Panicum virgatum TaxID=38727 RepID=A0A8T0SG60_PANVG|nr:hypothetical protein PVAP13_5KG261000 [Panicum virgatum]KAG2597360.1 hypothetical protein PVAP13_5KG261000 [Panicum virgatum]
MGCSPEAAAGACPDCLERLVRSDLGGSRLSFVHGLSDSPLPFAASAVVQIASDGAEETNGRQHYSSFVLVGLGSKKCDNNSLENGIHNDTLPEQTVYNDDDQDTQQSDSSSGKGCIEDHENPPGLSKQQKIISTIAKLTPVCYLSIDHTSEVEELILSYLNFSTEENVINSLNLLSENKISGLTGLDFLSFVGFSAFDDLHPSGHVRHPNILPVLGVLETSDHCFILHPKAPYTLENIMHYSPEAFCSDWHIRFLIYQIISALAYLHDSGVHHGNLRPSNVLMSDSLWPYLSITDTCPVKHSWGFSDLKCSPNSCCFKEDCSSKAIYTGFKLQSSLDWQSHFKQWWKGELSNYEYLLVLNKLAGRRWGDPAFHTVMPWVIDFTVMPDESSDNGWRDLTKSKWRLAKGDEQLDFTYSSSEISHHVSDECLSELAVCSYKARRLPKTILRLSIPSASCQLLAEWLLVMALFIYGMGKLESSLQLMLSHLLPSHSKLHLLSRQTCSIRMHSPVEYCQMHFVVVCIHLCIIWNLMVYLLRVWETVQSDLLTYLGIRSYIYGRLILLKYLSHPLCPLFAHVAQTGLPKEPQWLHPG